MPVTVRGTDILFNDGSTQATAAGAITTTAVLNATAAASVGAVGTYALMRDMVGSTHVYEPGTTLAGSNLRFVGVSVPGAANSSPQFSNTVPAGTWRIMGYSNFFPGSYELANRVFTNSVWLRIS